MKNESREDQEDRSPSWYRTLAEHSEEEERRRTKKISSSHQEPRVDEDEETNNQEEWRNWSTQNWFDFQSLCLPAESLEAREITQAPSLF